MDFPKFKYHPNPILTGSIIESEEECECCEQTRGYVYNSVIYAKDEIEFICPWCIADGSAAKEFNGTFSDDHPLLEANVAEDVISEVCERTPGYNSWQQEIWQAHCGTACEFYGDAEKEELIGISGKTLGQFLSKEMIKPDAWKSIIEHYEKGNSPAIYKFKCPECSEFIFTMDFL